MADQKPGQDVHEHDADPTDGWGSAEELRARRKLVGPRTGMN